MLSCWTQSMQRRQRFCSNLHVSISAIFCLCVSLCFRSMYAQNPQKPQQIAWYELHPPEIPTNMCPLTRLITSLLTLEPSDLLIPMAIEQDGDQTFCKNALGQWNKDQLIVEWMMQFLQNGDGLCMIKLIQIVYIDFIHHPPTNMFEIRMRLWCWKC